MPTIWDVLSGKDRKKKTEEQESQDMNGGAKKDEAPKRQEMSQSDFSGYGSGSKKTRPGYSKKWKQ